MKAKVKQKYEVLEYFKIGEEWPEWFMEVINLDDDVMILDSLHDDPQVFIRSRRQHRRAENGDYVVNTADGVRLYSVKEFNDRYERIEEKSSLYQLNRKVEELEEKIQGLHDEQKAWLYVISDDLKAEYNEIMQAFDDYINESKRKVCSTEDSFNHEKNKLNNRIKKVFGEKLWKVKNCLEDEDLCVIF